MTGMKTFWRNAALTAAVIILAGCAAVLNPYESEFSCPNYDRGQCVPVEEAYRQSLKGRVKRQTPEEYRAACKKCRKQAEARKEDPTFYCASCYDENDPAKSIEALTGESPGQAESLYQKELHKRLAGMLRQPITPMVAPPTVIRGIILPYRGDMKGLYGERYFYMMVDEPKWVIGEFNRDRSGEEVP